MDGSGSMHPKRMRLMQMITYSWLSVTARSGVQVVAAIHDVGGPGRVGGPARVRWVFHPHRTPAVNRMEAAAAVAALPERGFGGQRDALAIRHVVDEARALARGRDVYPIMITDCGWCHSFSRTGMSAFDEVQQTLRALIEDDVGDVSPILVALSKEHGQTGLESLVDVIPVPEADLADPAKVATRLGEFVLARVRDDRRKGRKAS